MIGTSPLLKRAAKKMLDFNRIRDLEARLSEKEMLIHLLQRASMDRELVFNASTNSNVRLPEPVSMLNRFPLGAGTAQPHHSSQHESKS